MPKGPQVHKRRPRDPNQLGKLIVDISVGDLRPCWPRIVFSHSYSERVGTSETGAS
jgi:hypothetical protein